MTITDRLYSMITRGLQGNNKGLSLGIPTLDKSIYGIMRKELYLLAADSGSGKSSFALYSFVFRPLFDHIDDKDIWILYFSFEMSSEILFAKLLSLYIYEVYNVVITYEQILSLRYPLTDEGLEYVNRAKEWLEKIEERIAVIDTPLSSDQIEVALRQFTEQFGRYEKLNDTDERYIPNNPEQYIICICDHLGLINANPIKIGIDETTKSFIHYRNTANITGVLVQQLNRNFKAVDRKLNGMEMIQLNDFSDSSGPVQGAEVVLALYDPYREKQSTCKGYDIKELKDRARIIQVLKHRFGKSNFIVGSGFYGEIGKFIELPKPEDLADYNQYKHLSGKRLDYNKNIDNNEVR